MTRHREAIPPPSSDEPLARHQFYTNISCNLHETNGDVDGIGKKVNNMYIKLDAIGDKVKEYATRGNTIITCVSVLWFMLGGGLTMYVKSVIESANKTIETVRSLENRILLIETANTNNAPAIESIEKIKRNLATLQKEVGEKGQ